MRAEGFQLLDLEPRLSEADADQILAVDQGRSLRHPYSTSMVRQRVASEVEAIQNFRPAIVVIGSTLTMLLSARITDTPISYIKPYAYSRTHIRNQFSIPIFDSSNGIKRVANRAAAQLTRLSMSAITWKPRSFRKVAKEYGVTLPRRTIDAIETDLNLIASIEPVGEGITMHAPDVAVGPIFAKPKGDLPAEVSALADRTQKAVYVGMGSSVPTDMILAVLRALDGQGFRVITGAGYAVKEALVSEEFKDVTVFDYLPAHLLRGLVDACVIHGGEGTVQTACYAGLPFLGIAMQAEQAYNIDFCERYGNARRFTKADLKAGRLAQLTNEVLEDTEMLQQAEQLRRELLSQDGAANAATEIIEFCGEPN